MRKTLLYGKYVPNPELDKKKEQLTKDYDRIFEEIRRTEKKSKKHLRLLDQLIAIEKESRKLLADNRAYFELKEEHHWEMALGKEGENG